MKAGKGERKAVMEYKVMVYRKDVLFGILPGKSNGEEDWQRIKQMEDSWGVRMGTMEEICYEDMKSEWKMECGRGVDPVWHQAMMRKQRDREKLEEYREKRDNQFQYKSIPDIEKMLTEDGSFCYSSEEEGPPTKMKLKVSYARDTSTLLPKADPLYKIRKVDVKGKQRDKTAAEFEEALAVLLGRKADRKAMDYSTFKECLTKMLALNNVSLI